MKRLFCLLLLASSVIAQPRWEQPPRWSPGKMLRELLRPLLPQYLAAVFNHGGTSTPPSFCNASSAAGDGGQTTGAINLSSCTTNNLLQLWVGTNNVGIPTFVDSGSNPMCTNPGTQTPQLHCWYPEHEIQDSSIVAEGYGFHCAQCTVSSSYTVTYTTASLQRGAALLQAFKNVTLSGNQYPAWNGLWTLAQYDTVDTDFNTNTGNFYMSKIAQVGSTTPPGANWQQMDNKAGADPTGGSGASYTLQPGSVTSLLPNTLYLSCITWFINSGSGTPDGTTPIDSGFTMSIHLNDNYPTSAGVACGYLIQTSVGAEDPTWKIDSTGGTGAYLATAQLWFH